MHKNRVKNSLVFALKKSKNNTKPPYAATSRRQGGSQFLQISLSQKRYPSPSNKDKKETLSCASLYTGTHLEKICQSEPKPQNAQSHPTQPRPSSPLLQKKLKTFFYKKATNQTKPPSTLSHFLFSSFFFEILYTHTGSHFYYIFLLPPNIVPQAKML